MSGWPAALAATIVLGAAALTAGAQDRGEAPYKPLFTESMIRQAAPEQRERMRAAEAANRQAHERRQRREQAEAADARPPADAAPAAAAPAPRTTRSRIYRWVDDKGRVHFGDAPAGEGAEEVKIRRRSAAPAPAAPTAAPPLPSTPAAPAGSERREDTRRGS